MMKMFMVVRESNREPWGSVRAAAPLLALLSLSATVKQSVSVSILRRITQTRRSVIFFFQTDQSCFQTKPGNGMEQNADPNTRNAQPLRRPTSLTSPGRRPARSTVYSCLEWNGNGMVSGTSREAPFGTPGGVQL